MRAILASAGVTLMVAALLAQQAPTFRSRVDTVDVHVTVRDANGRLVPDLAKDDFELFDNGKPVELAVFSGDPQPIAMSILLDRSGSTENRSTQVLDAAEAFVGELRGDDRGALHTLSFECQPLTTEKARLSGMLRSPVPIDMGSPIWSGLDRTMTSMADAPGRRAILLFSDGEDTGPSMGSMIVNGTTLLTFPGQRPGPCHPWTTPSVATFDEALKRAQRDGVMVYTVGIQNANGKSNDGDLRTIAQKSGGDRYQLKDPAELTAAFKRICRRTASPVPAGIRPRGLRRQGSRPRRAREASRRGRPRAQELRRRPRRRRAGTRRAGAASDDGRDRGRDQTRRGRPETAGVLPGIGNDQEQRGRIERLRRRDGRRPARPDHARRARGSIGS